MRRRGQLPKSAYVTMVAIWSFLGGAVALGAPNPNSSICFRDGFGVPGFPDPPQIDGCLIGCSYASQTPNQHDDFGWTGAFQFVANPGALPDKIDTVAQGVHRGNAIYMSFSVKNDPRIDDDDAVLLAFKNKAGGYALVSVFPFAGVAGAPYSGAAKSIVYTPGTAANGAVTWDAAHAQNGPGWVAASVTSGCSGNPQICTWILEVKLTLDPGSVVTVENSGFDFFFDLVRVYDTNNFLASHFSWPPGSQPGTASDDAPPPLDQWGMGRINSGTCGGVSFEPQDIKTNQTDPTRINTNPLKPNRFSVTLKNTTIDTRAGANQNKTVKAKDVSVRFRIANFGLVNVWDDIPGNNGKAGPQDVDPATTNPANSTVPPAVVAAPGVLTLQTPAPGWVPASNLGHQCILAELSSTNNDTVFQTRSAYRNMNFGFNPGFDATAFIDGRGYGEPPGGGSEHVFDIMAVPTFQFAYGDGTVDGIPLGKLTSQVTWTLSGYRHTGRMVTLDSCAGRRREEIKNCPRKYESVEPVGYFGYVVRHELGDEIAIPFKERHAGVIAWAFDFSGTDAEKWARVNVRLAQDKEKPLPQDWDLKLAGIDAVSGDGMMRRVAVRKETVRKIAGTVQFTTGNAPRPWPNCCATTGSSSATAFLGLGVLGIIAWRRRRR